MFRSIESNGRILFHACRKNRLIGDERIILRCNQQIRDAYLSHDPLRPCTLVVLRRVFEPERRSRNRVVELTYCPDGTESVVRIALREKFRFVFIALHQPANKSFFIKEVVPTLEFISTSGQIKRGANRTYRP